MMIGGPAAPLRPEEATVLKICGMLTFCGTLQLIFAFTIPCATGKKNAVVSFPRRSRLLLLGVAQI